MKKLNLPVFKEDPFPHPPLTMDEYARFVLLMSQAFPHKDADEERKRESRVDVPFKLK